MASRPFIVIGDRTDHGGIVVSASQMTGTHGKGIARVGDQVTCPKKGHGTTVIVTGDPTMIIDGQPAARHGDKCACGAMLISSQFVSTASDGNGEARAAANSAQSIKTPKPGFISALRPEVKKFDLHFLVRDEITGQPLPMVTYKITLEDGTSIQGTTDSNGLTDKIRSDKQQKATLEVHHYGGNDDHGGADAYNRYDTCCC